MDYSKFIWPLTILIAAIILAVGYYVVEENKSESIERQQRQQYLIDQEKNKLEEEKLQIEKAINQKEFAAKRSKDCLDIYTNESKKYNNVHSWSYDDASDKCDIQYINKNWKEGTPELGVWNEALQIFENGKYFTTSY